MFNLVFGLIGGLIKLIFGLIAGAIGLAVGGIGCVLGLVFSLLVILALPILLLIAIF